MACFYQISPAKVLMECSAVAGAVSDRSYDPNLFSISTVDGECRR